MRFFHSIRWRLQVWYGLLLVFILTGFGYTAWRLQRATQLQLIDQDLERRIAVISNAMRRNSGDHERSPPERPRPQQRERERQPAGNQPPPPPPEVRLSPRDAGLFEGESANGCYYIAWLANGREISRSATAPPAVPCPPRGAAPGTARLRGTWREYAHFMATGECILVGRDVHEELAAVTRFAWILGGAGGVVLLLGLTGGWWVATRALRPLAKISATAAQIATGDLTQRIQVTDTSSELGELAQVLNVTFARLQASFTRQAQFTADASHELRTPVAVVLTQTQTALARERPAAEYRAFLTACQRAAQRMRRLTESLLTLARLDSGDGTVPRESCDLAALVHEATELLQPLASEQGVSLATELNPASCDGNAEQLGQIITNLVSNAIFHNRPGGEVQVRVVSADGVGVLTVSDTGQGIAPHDLPHIFERFYRSDQARTGAAGRTGLGLAITKAIVEAHGGTITVVTELGHGSTFTVRLPLVALLVPN